MRDRKVELLTVYQEVYAERLSDPFFYPARFWERVEGGSWREGFRLVTGRVKGELVGFTVGSILPANTAWWRGFKGDVDPDLFRETGTRTFGINELQVRPAWRRRGYAKAMSDALLEELPVRQSRPIKSWGFHTVGQMQPFDDSPLYEAMVKALD